MGHCLPLQVHILVKLHAEEKEGKHQDSEVFALLLNGPSKHRLSSQKKLSSPTPALPAVFWTGNVSFFAALSLCVTRKDRASLASLF